MGHFLSGVLGTDSQVQVNNANPVDQLGGWQGKASGLNDLLAQQAAGGGPNPAQQQFLQNSNAISQQQAQAYAGNRSLNPALAARMAGNTGAQLQQNAASTAGIQQAQQQLAAQSLQGQLIASQEHAINQAGAINAGIASGNQQAAQGIVGGILQGAGAAAGMAHGGMVQNFSSGGMPGGMNFGNPQSSLGRYLSGEDLGDVVGAQNIGGPAQQSVGGGFQSMGSGINKLMGSKSAESGAGPAPAGGWAIDPSLPTAGLEANGGKVSAMVSPGERYMAPSEAKKVAAGKESAKSAGKKIPGKAKVSGDSEMNDTVPATLDEGGVVIPRSLVQSGDEKAVQKFVMDAIRGQQKPEESDFREALKRAISGRKNQ